MSPTEFWQLTPRELALASGAFEAGQDVPPQRGELAELMRRYPDQVKDEREISNG